jgi:hypothetical protein
MFLRVELHAKLFDERKLRFEEIDVLLLIRRKLFEQILCNSVVH